MKVLRNKKTAYFALYVICALIFALQCHSVSAATHSLTLTSSGSQSVNLAANAGTAISSDAINVATTCRYGYNFTINTSVSDNNLYLGGDSSNNTEGTYFSPTDGATALNATTNKWGYYYNASTAPTNTSVFSPVPTLSSPATVKTPLTTPASSDINDNFNIYYGVSSSPTMAKGTYKMIPDTNNSNSDGTIVYTATMAEACVKYTVHFSPTSEFEDNLISGTGTMSDQIIYDGITTPLDDIDFTAPNGFYFYGWNTAQDGSGTTFINQESVTDIAPVGTEITLYAMWTDCPPNTICYTANGSGTVGEMGDQVISDTSTNATLYAPNFKRNGYGFVSWNTRKNGAGTNYGPNEFFKFTAGRYNLGGQRFYAKWITSAGNMQNWSGCSSMNIGDVTALKDTRNNDVYTVAKLVDGKCWMIENLRLADKDSSNNWINLSSSNTHNPSLPLINTWYYRVTRTTLTTSNHLSPTTDPTQAYDDTWCTKPEEGCYNQSMLATNNTTMFTNNTASTYDFHNDVYSYGNYYSWYSATAGHGKYNNSTVNQSMAGDICPVGWHLPKGGNKSNEANNEYWSLIVNGLNNGVKPNNYDSETEPYYVGTEGSSLSKVLRAYPNNFVYTGNVNGGLNNRGNAGLYWTSTVADADTAYDLYFINNNVSPGTTTPRKYTGRAVRCIAGT